MADNPKHVTDEEIKAIAVGIMRKWTSMYNVGNLRLLVDFYAPDAKLMAPGDVTRYGREEIMEGLVRMRKFVASYHPHEPDRVGTIIENEMYYFSAGITCYNADGEPLYPGKGVFLTKKVDGEFLVYTDCFNYNTDLKK
ncbi:uncharacterized protein LOC100368638 [Saccoglossus kowalevskii]|uniref:Uncharacterized protein LOC100368638 n=1 Tax=Saccoglossus kowalevskii TaxID=10224 RepID=A0ABM0MIF1_SACKO|nr:PREDICTED: uncharacterized protein LOC100368638 [Saccoglossus kowalevskii]